jgi:hypothetical protein
MAKELITDINAPLDEGDMIQLNFKSTGLFWIQAAQITIIDWRLSNDKRFRIQNWTIYEPNEVVFKVEVLRPNPALVTVGVIAAAIIGVGIVFKLTLDSAYKIVNAPVEALQKPAVQAIAIGIVLAVLGSLGLKYLK